MRADPVSLRGEEGTLIIAADGVRFERFAMYGKPQMEMWPWAAVRHLAFEEERRGVDTRALAFAGIFGLLFRRQRRLVVLSLADGDRRFHIVGDIGELRAAARRMADLAPSGHVSVLGLVVQSEQ